MLVSVAVAVAAVAVVIKIEEVFVEAFVEMKNIILHLNCKFLIDSFSIAHHTTSTILLNYYFSVNICLFHRSTSPQHYLRLF